MPDILDQGEVDALLKAVKKGGVSTAAGAADFDSPNFGATEGEYDFKKPERVTKEQLRALQTIHEIFSRSFGSALSGMIRAIVDVQLEEVEQATYGEFINSLPNPTSFNLLHVMPMDGTIVFEFSPESIFPIIDRMLGGNASDGNFPARPLTQIEQHLTKTIIGRAGEQLQMAWSNLEKLDFQLTASESNPQLMQLHSPNEPVVVIRFVSKVAKTRGSINLCYPYRVIEPVISTFTAQTWLASSGTTEEDAAESMKKNMGKAALDVSVCLAETGIRVSDMVDLQPGHIIQTAKPADSEITLSVEGKMKFKGKPGVFKNHKSILITRPIYPGEEM